LVEVLSKKRVKSDIYLCCTKKFCPIITCNFCSFVPL